MREVTINREFSLWGLICMHVEEWNQSVVLICMARHLQPMKTYFSPPPLAYIPTRTAVLKAPFSRQVHSPLAAALVSASSGLLVVNLDTLGVALELVLLCRKWLVVLVEDNSAPFAKCQPTWAWFSDLHITVPSRGVARTLVRSSLSSSSWNIRTGPLIVVPFQVTVTENTKNIMNQFLYQQLTRLHWYTAKH